MNLEKALNLLNLDKDFNDEELKISYRKISHKYHPDKWEGTEFYDKALRKQQDINAARDYLRNYLKNNRDNSSQNKYQFDIVSYVREKIDELMDIIKDNGIIIHDEELKDVIERIKEEIYSFETDAFSYFTTTKENVDKYYASCLISIRMILENFVKSFYQKYYIDESDAQEKINYDCNLKQLYNQLLKIKEKYSKEFLIIKRLDTEIEQYKNYAGYDELALLIDVCKNNAKITIRKNNYQNIEEEIKKMHQIILDEVFKTYYLIKNKLTDSEKIVANINDENIKKEYLNIKNSFNNGTSFNEIEQLIKKLEKLISKYQEEELKKQQYKEKEEAINRIYQSLITRYSEALKKYNIVTDSSQIKTLVEFLNQTLQLFSKGCENFKDLEFFSVFDNITFQNETSDREKLENANNSLQTNNSNVYIKITNDYMFDDKSFFYLDEENMIMYKTYSTETIDKKITQEQLTSEYISIEEFLKSAIFVGEYRRMLTTEPIKYLYETERIVIYSIREKIEVCPKAKLHDLGTIKTWDKSFEPFKNQQYLFEMIEKQVKQQVEEYKKKQSPKSNSYSPNKNIYGPTPFNTEEDYYYDESGYQTRR